MIIAPSLLSADFLNLGREIDLLNSSSADWIHFDVMDGVFVPNISFGLTVLEAVAPVAKKPLDVHLMIDNPTNYIKDFAKAGADHITVHYENATHLHRTLSLIKDEGKKAGLALNPHTPVSFIDNILTELDIVLIMSVNPGFGGQQFLPLVLTKISELESRIREKNLPTKIIVDGGINLNTIQLVKQAGAHGAVAGNAVFKQENSKLAISQLREKALSQLA